MTFEAIVVGLLIGLIVGVLVGILIGLKLAIISLGVPKGHKVNSVSFKRIE